MKTMNTSNFHSPSLKFHQDLRQNPRWSNLTTLSHLQRTTPGSVFSSKTHREPLKIKSKTLMCQPLLRWLVLTSWKETSSNSRTNAPSSSNMMDSLQTYESTNYFQSVLVKSSTTKRSSLVQSSSMALNQSSSKSNSIQQQKLLTSPLETDQITASESVALTKMPSISQEIPSKLSRKFWPSQLCTTTSSSRKWLPSHWRPASRQNSPCTTILPKKTWMPSN